LTALISTKSAITSFAVVQLDGTLDWMVTQRQALLAWTGHSISVRPTVNRKMVRMTSFTAAQMSKLTIEELGALG